MSHASARVPMSMRGVVLVSLALWLLVSACAKLSALGVFREALLGQGLVSRSLVPMAVWGVPIAELLLSSVAVWRVTTSRSVRSAAPPLLLAFAVLWVYTTALAIWPPEEPTGCGCGFSRAPVEQWWPLAMRNAACALLALGCWVLRRPVVPGEQPPATTPV